MSLSTEAVDRIFIRMTATYGTEFHARYAGVPVNDVKAVWSHELAGFDGRLKSIAWALENLPERCPNAIEFRNLCRRAPEPEAPRLPEPQADQQRVAEELAKLAPLRAKVKAAAGVDHKGWARGILARHEAGDPVRPICLRFAREALGPARSVEDGVSGGVVA